MCELIRFYKEKGFSKEDVERIKMAVDGSCTRNRDGLGFIVDREFMVKSDKKEDILGKLSEIVGHKELLVHTRIATSGGTTTDNTHPLETKDWYVMHNGILSGYEAIEGKSDTAIFASELQKNGNIKKTLEDVSGSYSIFFLNKNTKELFYAKENSTSFDAMFVSELEMYISASRSKSVLDNMQYCMFIGDYFRDEKPFEPYEMKIEPEIIYKVDADKFKRGAKFKEKLGSYSVAGQPVYNNKYNWCGVGGTVPEPRKLEGEVEYAGQPIDDYGGNSY